MTQPTIELLPCPFCGGTAGMRENGIGDYYVKCFVCESKASDYRCEEPTHAAGRWNRRAALTAQAGDGNRLPEEVDARKLAHDLMGQYALLDQHIEDFGEDSDEAFAQFSRIVSLLNKAIRAALTAQAGDGNRLPLDEIRKDAERYRFLRAQHINFGGVLSVVKPTAVGLGCQTYTQGLLDDEIDAAIAAAKDGVP